VPFEENISELAEPKWTGEIARETNHKNGEA